MTKRLILESKGVLCKIEADNKIINEISEDKFTYHHVPDVKIVENTKVDVAVFQDNALEKLVSIAYPNSRFRKEISGKDIVTVGEYLLERRRQEANGQYALSSATACYDGQAVTFFGGATNLGKTSSMLSLVERYGYNFLSDEKTLINLEKSIIQGGSRSIPTRKGIIRDKVGAATNDDFYQLNSEWSDQMAALFVYPHLDHGLKEPIFYQFKHLDFYWLLIKELSSVIRGAVRLVDNFTYQLPSLDTEELAQSRIQNTKKFTKNVPCFYFQGSIEQITKFVDDFIKGKKKC